MWSWNSLRYFPKSCNSPAIRARWLRKPQAKDLTPAYDKIAEHVHIKSLRLHKKLLLRDSLNGSTPIRKLFVDGASFYYLGTAHRLRIVDRTDKDFHGATRAAWRGYPRGHRQYTIKPSAVV